MIVAANRQFVLAIVLLVAGAGALSGQSSSNPRVDSIFAPFDKRDSPGCAVAVVDSGKTVFAKGYGMASLEHDLPITTTSAFYSASVAKQFTAFAIAMLAEQQKLSLDDDIRKWIPEVPNFGKTITIDHLIHHTSGLRDYFGLLGMTGWPSDGPLTEAKFLDLVSRQRALNFEPGTRFLYSNTGYVLLSILVKRVSGQSLREFTDSAMFAPLGMTNSHFRDDHTALVKNRAFAYSPSAGGWKMNVPGFDVVGDGGLFITIEDLAKWAHRFDTTGDPLLVRVHTRGRLASGDSIPYAFGLTYGSYRGRFTVEHSGAYGGYRTNLLRFPAQNFAVVMLCNTSTANPVLLSQQVASVFLGNRLGPVTASTSATSPVNVSSVSLSREQLSRYAGAYWDAKTETLRRIEVRDTVLGLTGTPTTLVLTSDTTFRWSNANITLGFTKARDGRLHLEEVTPNGDKFTYRRMPSPKTDARSLGAFTGAYVSDELDTTWRIERRAGTLVLRRTAVPDITLQPVFLDAFNSPLGVVRFRRTGGRITGLVVGAGRVTGFQFRKT
jgi:CubicO group peptidase (beta-lactamase class C family)